MKKKGYTLAEALVAMGVVGVVAALMLPLMNKYKPDGDKALFIRAYDSIVEATSLMVNDEEIYPLTFQLNNDPQGCDYENNECNYLDYSRAPLRNYIKATLPDGTEIVGSQNSISGKYCSALAYYLHSLEGCKSNSIKLINNVEISIENLLSDESAILNTVTLPSGKKYELYTFLNGQIIPAYDKESANDTISHLLTRANWKKGKNVDQSLIDDEIKRYKDMYKYWKENTPSYKRKNDGTIIPENPPV